MCRIVMLKPGQFELYQKMNELYGEVFEDEVYTNNRPDKKYMQRLLKNQQFIALLAMDGQTVAGALCAYEIIKFEQNRSEIYIYDLAVSPQYRRKGIATDLIQHLKTIAKSRNAYTIFVQADTDEDDQAAIALYTKLGVREDVLHFDIEV